MPVKKALINPPVLVCALAWLIFVAQGGFAASAGSDPTSLDTGFREMYNLDFSAAHKTFETWQELHPEDALGPAANAAAYLFAEFERLHILEIDLFTEKKQLNPQLPPDPAIKIAFENELAKADEIAGRALAQS